MMRPSGMSVPVNGSPCAGKTFTRSPSRISFLSPGPILKILGDPDPLVGSV